MEERIQDELRAEGQRLAGERWRRDNPDWVAQGRETPTFSDYAIARMDGVAEKCREACRDAAAAHEYNEAKEEYERLVGRTLRARRQELAYVEQERRRVEEELERLCRKQRLLEIAIDRTDGLWRIEESSAARRYRNLCGKWPDVEWD